MAKRHLEQYDKNGNLLDIYLNDDEVMVDGQTLADKLSEMEEEIEDAGSGDGTVTGVKVGSITHEPTEGVVDLSEPFNDKVDKDPNKELIPSTDLAKLQNLPTATELGNTYATKTELGQKANSADVYSKSQTYSKGEVDDLVEGIEAGETVVINSDGANIVDEHDNNSVLLAPSARQMKLMYNNIMAIYNGLANIAFTNGKPTLDWIGSKTKYTLSYGTMTGCTADVAAGQVNEGALRIKLTPTQASYAFTSVTVNGESVATTSADDSLGSVYLDIVVNGNITVAATAISGRGIDFTGSTGCSIGAAGVATGQDLDTAITANEHYTLPSSITVKIGNTNVTHTYTRAQDNKTATLHIDAANITGDLTITCTADEDAHVTIAISGSNFVVKQGNTQLSNGSKVYNGSAAQTLTIEPASGYKFSTLPSADKGTMTNNGYYEASSLEIGTSVEGTLTITAAGAALDTFSIDLSGLVGVASSNPATSILEGSPYSTTLSKTDASAAGSVIVGTCTMGNENIAPQSGTTINVAHVTGDIVLAATVGVQPSLIHSYDMDIQEDGDGKHYIPDKEGNQFPLYNGEDAGLDAGSGLTYPSGYYGNSSYSQNSNGGTVKYGNPVLGLSKGDDFTIVMKDLFVYPKSQNINPAMNIGNNGQQVSLRFHAERAITRGTNNSEIGQFNLSVQRNAASGAIGNGDYVQLYITFWTHSGSYFGTTGRFPCNRALISGTDTYTHTYHLAMSFVASTSKATAYLIDIDNQAGTVTVTNGGEITVSADGENKMLDLKAIVFKPMNEMGGLDIYNYAVGENAFSTLYALND